MLLLAVLICLCAASLVAAGAIWNYESVDSNGNGNYPLCDAPAYDNNLNVIQSNKVTIQGVALAGMNDVWTTADPGGQYNIFVQDNTSNCGGIQVWAGDYGWYQPPWFGCRRSMFRSSRGISCR